MIKSLHTEGIGLAPRISVEWARRFNLITGDNGLGKSFLLDLSWWALTGTWAGQPAAPQRNRKSANVDYSFAADGETLSAQAKLYASGSSTISGDENLSDESVVVYARADGGISVWDQLRNGMHRPEDAPSAFHFDAREVWNGLDVGDTRVCEGLERDWVGWQKAQEPQFTALVDVLEELSPPGEPITPGSPTRVFLGEGRDRPTIVVAGQTVPLVHASAGMRRILSLAYVLVWSWYEAKSSAELLALPHPSRFVVLIDEPETHLHPRWQRTVLPSLRRAVRNLEAEYVREPQMIVATHSPLVLASIEPFFDPTKDDLIRLELSEGRLEVSQGHWSKQGDAVNWLTSETFGLEQARNVPAEEAIEAAEAFMRNDRGVLPPELDSKDKINAALRQLLPDNDPFWARWIVHTEDLNA